MPLKHINATEAKTAGRPGRDPGRCPREERIRRRKHSRREERAPLAHRPAPLRDAPPVVFHCKSGARTRMNAHALADCTDAEAYILDGGIEAWKAAGLPVKRG